MKVAVCYRNIGITTVTFLASANENSFQAYLLYVVQSLAERETAVTYKGLMQHLKCGAEIEALFGG